MPWYNDLGASPPFELIKQVSVGQYVSFCLYLVSRFYSLDSPVKFTLVYFSPGLPGL